jgi:hypothetical protein
MGCGMEGSESTSILTGVIFILSSSFCNDKVCMKQLEAVYPRDNEAGNEKQQLKSLDETEQQKRRELKDKAICIDIKKGSIESILTMIAGTDYLVYPWMEIIVDALEGDSNLSRLRRRIALMVDYLWLDPDVKKRNNVQKEKEVSKPSNNFELLTPFNS